MHFKCNANTVYIAIQMQCKCSIQTSDLSKIGIKCFSRSLLEALGREPSKPHFQNATRAENCQKLAQIFLKISTRQIFGYPGLDAGLHTSRFDIAYSLAIAFPIDQIGRDFPSLVYTISSQVTSSQSYNLNKKRRIIQKVPKSLQYDSKRVN